MRRFEATDGLPPGSVFRTGPGGAPYVVLTSAAGPEVYVEVVDAVARGWLREVRPGPVDDVDRSARPTRPPWLKT